MGNQMQETQGRRRISNWKERARDRARETWFNLRWDFRTWLFFRGQPLWRRLGGYCGCRREVLEPQGLFESAPIWLGLKRKNYRVDVAGPWTDSDSQSLVVRRDMTIVNHLMGRTESYSLALLCTCGRWVPAGLSAGPSAADQVQPGSALRRQRTLTVRRFSSINLAEQQITQLMAEDSHAKWRARGWQLLIGLIASGAGVGIGYAVS